MIARRYRAALLQKHHVQRSVRFTGTITSMDRAACEAHFARAYDSGREAVISIADPGGRRLLPEDVMRLDLDIHDYTPAEAEAERLPVVLFTGEDRDRILDFVARLPPTIVTLRVHYEMGISRSRAIVAALRRLRGEDDLNEFKRGIPNAHIYRKMLRLPPIEVMHWIIARDVVESLKA